VFVVEWDTNESTERHRVMLTNFCMFFGINLLMATMPMVDFIIIAQCFCIRLFCIVYGTCKMLMMEEAHGPAIRIGVFTCFIAVFVFFAIYATEVSRRTVFLYSDTYIKTAERQQLLVQYA
jgi:hypothetical protein